ncbi:unnamed protein product [Cylicocyclus nassatus]|uniref:DUF155 domain-containing protein n=1 Tax=Cylicocyclus nassatus TaxID=53992 RepID=A0AA36GSA6_CYLNA|nr:unnamed protein product [Cylicocyclus nassatus]
MLRRSLFTLFQINTRPSCSRTSFPKYLISSSNGLRRFHSAKLLCSVEEVRREEDFEQRVINNRRLLRKRRQVSSALAKNLRKPEVVAMALSESLDLDGILTDPSITNMFTASYIDEEFDDTIHLVKKLEYSINPAQINEIFVFQDGVVVFWNIDHAQRAHTIRDLERYMDGEYESSITMEEQDTMPYTLAENEETNVKHDCFVLNAEKHGVGHRSYDNVLERFSLSQAFAASVKVGVWETLLNNLAEPLSETTKALKQGVVPWSRKEALKKSGEFAAMRHSINLDCTLLNRDFYWDHSQVEKFYLMSARHFILNRRISGLNRRLDYCEELVKMVDNILALRHASTLEWMIIVLIVIELKMLHHRLATLLIEL